ncbi:sensor histidine kinase [Nocardia sp. NBC_00511]|uniref:sensor histidine kinase n=1 Tax=Nocardia sp. NBC_00511 TaxID=2903591 RepID=UPI0030DF40DF
MSETTTSAARAGNDLVVAGNATTSGVLAEAASLALLMRHIPYLWIAVVYLLQPNRSRLGTLLDLLLAGWALGRLATRRGGIRWTAADLLVALGYLAATAAILPVQPGLDPNAPIPPQIVAAQTVISIAIEWPPHLSIPATALIMAADAYGYAQLMGPAQARSVFGIYFLAIQCGMALLVRALVVGSARLIDAAEAAGNRVRVAAEVDDARRGYQREQWRILHDTAASTLLMIAQGAPLTAHRLARQARRDLAALAAVPEVDDDPVDLAAMLRPICAEATTPVQLNEPMAQWVPATIARAVAGAVREALTNVDRHARAGSVSIALAPDRLRVRDDGAGFPVDLLPGDRHGIRNSIIDRMRQIGGDAVITSRPGETTVEISWQVTDVEPSAGSGPALARTDRMVRRFAYGMAAVAVILTLTAFGRYWFTPSDNPIQLALMAANIGCAVAACTPVRRSTTSRRLLLAVALSIAPVLASILPSNEAFGGANWALADTGWTVAVIMYRSTLRCSIPVLTLSWLLSGVVILARDHTLSILVSIGYLLPGSLVLQALSLAFTAFLDRAARTATALDDEARRLTAARAVATALQRDYQNRYHDISADLVPLLSGFACLTLDPGDPDVRRVAGLEYSRLRLLFAQSDTYEHQLLQDLRPSIDHAEQRGVSVTLEVSGALPTLTDSDCCRLLTAPALLLSDAATRARVVILAEPDCVMLSVRCDYDPTGLQRIGKCSGIPSFQLTTTEEDAWLQVRHFIGSPAKGMPCRTNSPSV